MILYELAPYRVFFCPFSAIGCPLSAKVIVYWRIFIILKLINEEVSMIEKMVLKLVDRMEIENIIRKSERVHYEYALIIMIERFITIGTILVIGFVSKLLIPTICFLIAFLALRKRTGGYHADKFWRCYLATNITYVAVIYLADSLSGNKTVLFVALALAVLVIEVIGTVNHPNMDMNKEELHAAKSAARLLVLLEIMVIAIWSVLDVNEQCVCYMSIAIILCALLMCIAKIIKQEVKME